ncbi:MAG: SPOR domain-containing protein [Syntrophaceae bacterium]|nr:SPOR domain-containing protein [Syntrophaceae bacterium]
MTTGNTKNFELKIGKTGLFVVVIGMAVLLCAAFLFGVDMGQNMDTYPEKIASLPQRALALVWRPSKIRMAQQNAPGKIAAANQAVLKSPSAAEEDSIDYTYHETLTSKKGLEKADTFKEKPHVAAAPKSEEDEQKGKFHIETKPQPVSEKEPVQEKEGPKDETGAQENPANYKFIVQVASMKDKAKAYQMNKKVASLGFQSKVIKIELRRKGVMFRVIASDLNDKEQAQQAAKKISAKTGTNCIVKKIKNKTSKN